MNTHQTASGREEPVVIVSIRASLFVVLGIT